MTKKGSMTHKYKGIALDIDYEISDYYHGDITAGQDFVITAIRVDGSDVDIINLFTGDQVQEIADSITCE
jgi:hypothetical protein